MRTTEEIKEAIEALKENKTKCRQYDFFGEDNYRKIDVMIEVIQHGKDEEDIFEEYENEYRDTAHDALDFLNGDIDLPVLLYPTTK